MWRGGYCVVNPPSPPPNLAGQRGPGKPGGSDGTSGGGRGSPPAPGCLGITVTTASRCRLQDEFFQVPNYSLSP